MLVNTMNQQSNSNKATIISPLVNRRRDICRPVNGTAKIPTYNPPSAVSDPSEITPDQLKDILAARSGKSEHSFTCSKERMLQALDPIITNTEIILPVLARIDRSNSTRGKEPASDLQDAFLELFPIQQQKIEQTSTKKAKKTKYFTTAKARAFEKSELASMLVDAHGIFKHASESGIFRTHKDLIKKLNSCIKDAATHGVKLQEEASEPSKLLRGIK